MKRTLALLFFSLSLSLALALLLPVSVGVCVYEKSTKHRKPIAMYFSRESATALANPRGLTLAQAAKQRRQQSSAGSEAASQHRQQQQQQQTKHAQLSGEFSFVDATAHT